MGGRRTTERAEIERRIDQGRGLVPADLVIRDVRLFDLVTGLMFETDIAITGDTIVGTYGRYEGRRVIEGRGRIAVPGFIDTHLHVESSLVTPLEFDRCVLPHGVTTALCDPHEIANVLGLEGLHYFLACALATAMDLRVNLPSCVPATHMETAGARLSAADLLGLADHPKVLDLAEVMNFPGVLAKDPDMMEKLAAFSDRTRDGHAPLVRGLDLNGYIAAGIANDHESTGAEEALEKIRKGMHVLIREGSVCKDLKALAPILNVATSPFLAFCTDDRNPLEIAHEGHLDFMIRTAIASGVPALAAYRAASTSAATAFGLTDRGLVAPGRRADIVLLDDLDGCAVSDVVAAGRLVGPDLFAARPSVAPVGLDSMRAPTVSATDFRTPASRAEGPVIGIIPGKIITDHLTLTLPYADGERRIDLDQDVVKVAVVERHGVNGNIGRGFVKGFGLKRGAIASSVGHDSHNITVIGADEADMARAVNRLGEIRGGFVVVEDGRVTAEIALPVAGLMSLSSFETVTEELLPLRAAAKALGCTLAEPFLQVAFLPLLVIPHLKIGDFGLVDVDRFTILQS
ncbi:adenine deaminase [Segnochrobactrum spirostomi]|uniref:Adenine deaminase n=1 Tax=Segnochrobactrum spirostomi TaxID=2608987 RepID=A0A6A7Y4E9_9HYPH|nr:adenine deaminase [Segnochrobactrum spirostomi]MQT14013.1 adenine deaminase [Segnochrobactrum spirostomi]